MKLYFLLTLIVLFFYLIFDSKKAMHMLQQNWYNEGNRYCKWLFSNFDKALLNLDLLFIVFFFFRGIPLIVIVVLVYLFLYIFKKISRSKEQSKKPLVITARVKRLFVTMSILYILCALVFVIKFRDDYLYIYYFILGLLVWLNPVILLITNYINIPVEKCVFNHFKRMATNKLNAITGLKRIAVTGSYGKTSTKNILNEILNVKFNSYATEKNFNTMNGLMISINNKLDKFNDVFIAEMGAFTRGDIQELCDFVKPQYGILTIIGTAHMDSFGSRENIQKGKFELIDSLPDDGIAVLNYDDEYQRSYKVKSKCKKVWVSIKDKNADVYASDIKLSNKGTSFKCTFKDKNESVNLETKLLGDANVYNILEAVALAYNLGLTLEQIEIGVKKVSVIEHRLELKKYGNVNLIDDAYNSNPVGSKMALDVLGMMDGKKIIVTPGMIELGSDTYKYNMEFGTYIAKVCDEVILIGEEQTKPIMDGLRKEKYDEKKVHILNDVKLAFPLMQELRDGETYVLIENDLPDIFNE